MGAKPITLIRQEYMQQIVDATNACPLPAVFKADVLENTLRLLQSIAESELKRDAEEYNQRTKQSQSAMQGDADCNEREGDT